MLALFGTSVAVAHVEPAFVSTAINPYSPLLPSLTCVYWQYHACHPPRLVASEKPHRCSHVPSRTLGLQQTPVLPCFSCFVAHTTRVHHRRVYHSRTNAIDSDSLWCMMHSHGSCHVLSQLVSPLR